ncbi:MAG: helix-turn-helix domain-containing protein [Myxococcota bacterium]
MRSLFDQDHYEVLETQRGATRDQIERSYRLALSTYADDSLAGYSVFSDGDSLAIRERIEVAYRVLADQESRSAYDATLDDSDDLLGAQSDVMIANTQQPVAPLPSVEEPPRELASVAEFEELDDGTGDFDGARLRRCRLRCGIELEEIAGVTKINNGYLHAIEEERFGDLPSKVYVRGFVTAFASTLGLDTKTVATSYMKLYHEGEENRRRSRFF